MRRCRKEMTEKFKKGKIKSDWEGRKRFFEDRGMGIEEVERKREEDKK